MLRDRITYPSYSNKGIIRTPVSSDAQPRIESCKDENWAQDRRNNDARKNLRHARLINEQSSLHIARLVCWTTAHQRIRHWAKIVWKQFRRKRSTHWRHFAGSAGSRRRRKTADRHWKWICIESLGFEALFISHRISPSGPPCLNGTVLDARNLPCLIILQDFGGKLHIGLGVVLITAALVYYAESGWDISIVVGHSTDCCSSRVWSSGENPPTDVERFQSPD